MKKGFFCFFAVVCVLLGVISISCACTVEPQTVLGETSTTLYTCDVKNFELSTAIEISKNGESYVKVKGNIFTYVTDPLTMYDMAGNKVAYAGDDYHFVAQDSHSIFVDGMFTCELVGLVDWFGESYEIYDKDQNKIASVNFDYHNTSGQMHDTEGNLIAEFSSIYFFNVFEVRISDKCKLDDKTVLMIFCSYYSDYSYDE